MYGQEIITVEHSARPSPKYERYITTHDHSSSIRPTRPQLACVGAMIHLDTKITSMDRSALTAKFLPKNIHYQWPKLINPEKIINKNVKLSSFCFPCNVSSNQKDQNNRLWPPNLIRLILSLQKSIENRHEVGLSATSNRRNEYSHCVYTHFFDSPSRFERAPSFTVFRFERKTGKRRKTGRARTDRLKDGPGLLATVYVSECIHVLYKLYVLYLLCVLILVFTFFSYNFISFLIGRMILMNFTIIMHKKNSSATIIDSTDAAQLFAG